jgi:glucose-6-phosphate isomerase
MKDLFNTSAGKRLQAHFTDFKHSHLRQLFSEEPDRFKRFSLETDHVFLDFSKNRINQAIFGDLINLAEERDLDRITQAMFNGEKINFTEQRAVLHTALRNLSQRPIYVDGDDVMPTINAELDRLEKFSKAIHQQQWRGYSNKPLKHIINIGIGGSHLGPKLLCEALEEFRQADIRVDFVSSASIKPRLENIDPETCLFIVSSKSFRTDETLGNAKLAREWLIKSLGDQKAIEKHFVAVSNNDTAAEKFGIHKDNIFALWDWVGGRYSVWSAIGLAVILLIGMDNFRSLLKGAWEMDEHFRLSSPEKNMPVIMAMLGVWYSNFMGVQSQAVTPYDTRLRSLPFHLQQLDMESNGKSINSTGHEASYTTGPVIFGTEGTDCQHAFFQSIHQGSHLIPVDFIAVENNPNSTKNQQALLLANCFAQSEALMRGKYSEEVRLELAAAGYNNGEIQLLTPHRSFAGNKPSNTLLLENLTPETMGALLSLYEHKVFVQGVIWNVNSFDQWGVELGKQLASQIYLDFTRDYPGTHDSSTEGLMHRVSGTVSR